MNRAEFSKIQAEYEATGFPGICDRSSSECSPSKLATKMWSQRVGLVSVSANAKSSVEEEIYLFCDFHAPKNATNIGSTPSLPPGLRPENLLDTVSQLSGAGFAKLRSRMSGQFGIRLQSTGDAANVAQSHIIMQTLDASPSNPYLVTIDQHILDPFTGSGEFDLIERDSIRRVFDGASAGGTAVLTSATMNWQSSDAGEIIRVGRNPGRIYTIVSRQSSTQVTLSNNITLPSIELTLTMDGVDEVELATSSGITNGITNSEGWSHLEKVITADKVYRVNFVPGDTGDAIYSIEVRRLN